MRFSSVPPAYQGRKRTGDVRGVDTTRKPRQRRAEWKGGDGRDGRDEEMAKEEVDVEEEEGTRRREEGRGGL